MQKKATRVGLDQPTRIILDSVANATKAALDFERQQDRRYAAAPTVTRLLPNTAAGHAILASDVDGPLAGLSLGNLSAEDADDEILYDDDLLGL